MARGRRKSKNHYFTKEHEQAIIDYANTRDVRVRTELYVQYIEPAFSEMVDKVVFTYKFTWVPYHMTFNIKNIFRIFYIFL